MSAGDRNPLASDLDGVLDVAGEDLRTLRGARLFITGGTGFVGSWILESLVWANETYGLDATAVVLTRDPDRFAAKAAHLAADEALDFARGDIVDFDVPDGPFTHVIHAAAESGTRQGELQPLRMMDTIVRGTSNVLEAARRWRSQDVLFVSSGAVYGSQPADLARLPEEWTRGPDPLAAASPYAEAKRVGEQLCVDYAAQHGTHVTIARCFAFVGPYLPLDAHFAIGNFIRDGLAGGPVRVLGDGTTVRSYLYAADLAAWLWAILLRGEPGRAYNVGSEDGRTIAEIAHTVAESFDPSPSVAIMGAPGMGPQGVGDRYVPSTERARTELGVTETVALADAVARTVAWHRSGPGAGAP
jgi:nucleoside-diphosphate-sugar epimerase